MNNRNVVVVIRERYANRVSLFLIRNRNGFEEDIDGVLITSESGTLADVNRISCAITESVSLLPPAGNGCESSRRHQLPGVLSRQLFHFRVVSD
ncbi:hypothetical protein OUZ56_029075 [Daphnia magna]|uniref:Uncharacterized protein n=1 Tax=Daphnia magna TaxID=35525 RepID=A0ABR0B5R7_9CRUS|nr:hypothetical protein OUZ56_029075 [Daphnia magna]